MTTASPELRSPADLVVSRYRVDLTAGTVVREVVPCEDLEDALGGVARATKALGGRPVADPFAPEALLLVNLGILSGTRVMTGLRTFFHGYSPLKTSRNGAPGLMWSTGSGHFGPKLRGLGVEEIVITGRADRPTLLHISPGPDGAAQFEFVDASDLAGRTVNDRIQDLHSRYPAAHFAVIGPAGENWESVRYAAVALSTDNQLESGDAKMRFCGRGGFGSVMGSKNLLGIAADGPDPGPARGLRDVNREINLGPGSQRYRDLPDDRGGTWRTFKMMREGGGLPEFNFAPTGTGASVPLQRPSVEATGDFVVKGEGCFLCGIKCHKNVYDSVGGNAARFRSKVDYEPIALLSSNLGIFDPDAAFTLIDAADELGLDSISLGVTLGYTMEYNRRHPEAPLAGGLGFGDAEGILATMQAIAAGAAPELGQGVARLAAQTGDTAYAMHSKGLEFPAYLPQTNPGYPWALAGGHMSMRTFFLLLIERETGLDYWVDAIADRGALFMRDDLIGLCKFAMIDSEWSAEAVRLGAGLAITADELNAVTLRTFLRGYAAERRAGFETEDYDLPGDAFEPLEHSSLPYFLTREFFVGLREKVMARLDARARDAGFLG
jgi:aldehyde:ferredoxin oxidoreductase